MFRIYHGSLLVAIVSTITDDIYEKISSGEYTFDTIVNFV